MTGSPLWVPVVSGCWGEAMYAGAGRSWCLTCLGSPRGHSGLALRLHSGMKAWCLGAVDWPGGAFSLVPEMPRAGCGEGKSPVREHILGGLWGHSLGTQPWGGEGGWPTLLCPGRASWKDEGTPGAQPLWPQAFLDLHTFAYLLASNR